MTTRATVFSGILQRPRQWRRLSVSTFGVGVIYTAALLAAVAVSGSGARAPARNRARKELVVTLLDLPKLSELRALAETRTPDAGGTSPARVASAVEEMAKSRPTRGKVTSTKVPDSSAPPLPEPRAQSDERPANPVGVAVQPEPERPAPAPQGETSAPPSPAVAAASRASSVPSTTGDVGADQAGGIDGAGGTRSGAGRGFGTGAGSALGDIRVLPFMDGMTRPKLVSKVDPDYTREARDAGISGLILTKCVITVHGSLERCRIIRGIPLMDQAVLASLSQWRYSPVLYQGRATAVEYVIPVRLVLP